MRRCEPYDYSTAPQMTKRSVPTMAKTRTYFCIDMKSFYASVECAERGYNPFETNLVVADLTRGKNALCLAITPAMKAQGIRNRCRLSEIPSNGQGPGGEFCVSDFRQSQEFFVENTHDLAYFPCPPCSPAGRGGMRAACGVNAVAARRGILIQGN